MIKNKKGKPITIGETNEVYFIELMMNLSSLNLKINTYQDGVLYLDNGSGTKIEITRCIDGEVLTECYFPENTTEKYRENFRHLIYTKVLLPITQKVIITCRIHGDFFQEVTHHLDGHGCKVCDHENNN